MQRNELHRKPEACKTDAVEKASGTSRVIVRRDPYPLYLPNSMLFSD